MSYMGVRVPTDLQDDVALTDWAEAIMLAERTRQLSKSRIRSYIREAFSDDSAEEAVERVLAEVKRRRFLCSFAYPFDQDFSGMKLVGEAASSPYLFLLCISVSESFRSKARYKEIDELFDLLVLDALKRYIGSDCKGFRFGSPASGERPKNFADSIRWLCTKMKLTPGPGKARKHAGDGGLDVVVWRDFNDPRSGYLVILAQCTVMDDWFDKARDLNEDVWRGWIDFGKNPHLALAVPFVVPHPYAKWDELRRNAHTILDRLRLCELLEGTDLSMAIKTKQWTSKEVVLLK
jgi:hypothetical protein